MTQDLSSHIGLSGRFVRQDSFRGGEDRNSQSGHDGGDTIFSHIDPPTWSTDTPDTDDLLAARIIFEEDSEHLMLVLIRNHFKIFYKPFLLQNLRDLSFNFGRRDVHLFEFGFRSVPNSGEHIRQRICH